MKNESPEMQENIIDHGSKSVNKHLFDMLPPHIVLQIWCYLDDLSLIRLKHSCSSLHHSRFLIEKFASYCSNMRAIGESTPIHKAQSLRIISVTADFSDYTSQENRYLTEYPVRTFSNDWLSQFFDIGRLNSMLTWQKPYHSLFQEPYHREGSTSDQPVSLVKMGCIVNSESGHYQGIAMVPTLFPDLIPSFYQIVNDKEVSYVVVRKSDASRVLKYLSQLGALPNRDLQVKYALSLFGDFLKVRDFYFNLMPVLSKFPIEKLDLTPPVSIEFSCKEKQNNLLALLDIAPQSPLQQRIVSEQRSFYKQFLAKLITAIAIEEDKLEINQRVQCLLALQRMEALLQCSADISYPNFLRVIETCLDEMLIIKSIENNQKNTPVSNTVEIIKQFITEVVGLRPEMATFRSSAMQAIWSLFNVSLSFFQELKSHSSVSLLVPHAVYFEMKHIFMQWCKILLTEGEQLNLKIDLNDFSRHSFQYTDDTLYDIYMGDFESNVQFAHDNVLFTDVNAFVDKQMQLRRKNACADRPLIVILDNTMSDFDEIHLPLLLIQFKEEIAAGILSVLVCHSGNKYIHLGTDKGLAALMYGYYNPQVFSFINDCISHEHTKKKLGDFDANSPTVLLTTDFLQHAKEEILYYSPLIRHRAAYLFCAVIPAALTENSGYFTVNSPFYDAKPHGNVVQNSCGFVVIKTDYTKFTFARTVHEKLWDDMEEFVKDRGISTRDGFGFSQTTTTWIQAPCSKLLRISIGTESLDAIAQKIGFICEYLIKINKLIEKYLQHHNDTLLYKATEHAQARLLVSGQNPEKAEPDVIQPANRPSAQIMDSSIHTTHSFFSTVKVERFRNQLNVDKFRMGGQVF